MTQTSTTAAPITAARTAELVSTYRVAVKALRGIARNQGTTAATTAARLRHRAAMLTAIDELPREVSGALHTERLELDVIAERKANRAGYADRLRALRSAQATIAMACKPPVITVDRDRVGTAVYACATCTCGYRGPWRRDVDGFPSQALQDCEAHDVATHGLVVPAGPATRIAAMHCDSCGRLVGDKQAAKYADTYQLDWALCPRCEVDA